jgi:type I restriction enzyme S subunit
MTELSSGWIETSLFDACELITDGTHHSPINGPEGDFKYITAKNIKKGGLDLESVTYVNASTHAEIYRRCPPKKGDVLYIKDGATTGIAVINPLDEQFSMLSSVALLRPDPRLLMSEYLCHQLNSPDVFRRMTGDMTGSAIRRLTLSTISRQTIVIAPLLEQQRIVSKIDSLSAKSKRARDQLDHIPRLVEKYKQAILAAAFDQALRSAGTQTSLANIAVEVRNGLSKKPHDGPPGIPILRISAVRSLAVNTEDQRYYPPTEAVPSTFLLREGDLLFTRYNGNPEFTAVCGVVRGVSDELTYPDKLIRVRLNEKASPNFVELMFASPQARAWLWPHIKTAAGQHGISGKDLKQCPVPLPPMAEQAKIVQHTQSHLAWVNRLASEATSARRLIDHLDQAVLSKAFRGELVPQDPSDEPASSLLERIRAERAAAPVKVKARGPKQFVRQGRPKRSAKSIPS